MKTKIIIGAACIILAVGTKAQKGIDNGTQYGSGEDSVRCLTNISLFIPYAKSGNYKDAYEFWLQVYEECPAATKNTYIYGIDILNWKISQETDPTKKEALVSQLMQLYDDRVKYFGDDKKYSEDWIVARKAHMYNQLKGEDTDPLLIHKWTGSVIEKFKEKTEHLAISMYMFASLKLYKTDPEKYKEQYVNDFLKCSKYIDEAIAANKAANGDPKDLESLTARKAEIEQNFATSGAADCETLQSIYADKIEANKEDIAFLKETMTLFRRLGCKETEAYFTASLYAYKIEPTAESAMGLGGKAFKEGTIADAEKYFNEAVAITDDKDIKSDLYYMLAVIAMQQNQFAKAKGLALKCLEEKPEYGRAYLLIAQAYSQAGRSVFPDDPVLAKTVFYAAVDKAERARQVDPACAEDANKLISSLRAYFPTKEEIFMHNKLNSGDNFTIGGWVGETVKIR